MSWKQTLRQQVDTGEYWKGLFKAEFDRHQFLDRSDAVTIIKEAQIEALRKVRDYAEMRGHQVYVNFIEKTIKELQTEDDSAVGMYFNGEQF
jgi:hypothetical protein